MDLPEIWSRLTELGLTSLDIILELLPKAVLSGTALTSLYFFATTLYNITFHPLRHFPGPVARHATKIPYLGAMWTGYHHRAIHALHSRYGPIVRVAPNSLSFINPAAWKDIYAHKKSRSEEMIKDPEFYVRNPDAPHIVNGNHEEHARYRRLYQPGFSARALREQEGLITGYVDMFIAGLTRECETQKGARIPPSTASKHATAKAGDIGDPQSWATVDMVQWFNFVTFDIIGDLAFGEPFGCLSDKSTEWLTQLNQIEEAQMQFRIIQHIPFLRRWARSIVNALISSDAVRGSEGHRKLTHEKVKRRVDNNASRPDFMDHILRQPEGQGFTFGEMLSNSATLIQAGSETTATLLSGALFLLMLHPEKMDKLVEELRAAVQRDGDMTIENTSRLVYLGAVLEESLRLYSPAVPGFPRQVPEGGAMIDGVFVPGGTSVSVNHYAAYHSPLNFTRPFDFVPERWIDLDMFPNDKREVLQPFMVGPRNCIGRSLAYAEGRLILGRAVWKFDFRLSESAMGWMDNQKGYVTWLRPEMETYIRLR